MVGAIVGEISPINCLGDFYHRSALVTSAVRPKTYNVWKCRGNAQEHEHRDILELHREIVGLSDMKFQR